ncbi:hypothetical protein NSP_32580 [Nodularia spumigena CCY9414]|nr:hypothetical protein NSP_32580 [Nodularia spumigena CCY9414]
MRLQLKKLFPTPHSPLPTYASKYGYATQAIKNQSRLLYIHYLQALQFRDGTNHT